MFSSTVLPALSPYHIIQDGIVSRNATLFKFNIFCVNFWLCIPMFAADSYYANHIFVVYMTFTFNATVV